MVDVEFAHSAYSAADLLRTEVRTQRYERIRVDLIVEEGSLIDQEHAANLAESMLGDRHQISPVTLRARMLDDGVTIVYDIIDGFHRNEGMKLIQARTNKPQELDAVVLYGCSDEEMYDLRVLAANSVKSVKFARMAEWMHRSFLSTAWKSPRIHGLIESQSLYLSQVFNLAQSGSGGSRLGLDPDESLELTHWAKAKSQKWRIQVSTLMGDLRTVELAAPELVQRVRTDEGGRSRKGLFTKAMLDAIAKHLPGEWELQIQLADSARYNNLVAEDLEFLSWAYTESRNAGDLPTMKKILESPHSLLHPKSVTHTTNKNVDTLRETYRRIKRGRKGHIPKSGERALGTLDQRLLEKHHVPEVIKSLLHTVKSQLANDIEIVDMPDYKVITLTIQPPMLQLNHDRSVILTEREAELMTIFTILEGVTIPDALLSVISTVEDGSSTRAAVESLQEKISQLSVRVSNELQIDDIEGYSWLAEK